jgi:predicted MFS family arabinose efflux permease
MARWLIALSAAFAVALNGTMVMPLVVTAIGRLPGYDEGLATLVASAEIAGIALYALTLPRLIVRFGRPVAALGFLAVAAGEYASFHLAAAPALAGARFVTGLGEGAVFSLVTNRLAATEGAERDWGVINLVGGTAMGLLLLGVSQVAAQPGNEPIFPVLSLFALALSPALLFTTERARTSPPGTAPRQASRSELTLLFALVVLIYGVQAGQWAIAGFVGERAGLAQGQYGFYLALSSVLGFVGAVVPALAPDRRRRLAAIALGILLMGASLWIFFNIPDHNAFFFGQLGLNIGFYIVTPFVTGHLTETDPDGALLARVLVLALVGAAGGTAAAGSIFATFGAAITGWAFMLPLAGAALCALVVFGRIHIRHLADMGDA